LKKAGCEIKLGKHTAVRLQDGQRFIRFDSIGGDYSEQALRERCAGTRNVVKKSDSGTRAVPISTPEKPNLLIDIQSKLQQGYGEGFRHWATLENLKQSAKTLIYLKEVGIDSYEELISQYNSVGSEFNRRHTRLKEVEKRLADITELQKQIGHYGKTKGVYADYKRVKKYQPTAWEKFRKEEHPSVAFYNANATDIILHQTAKKYFDEQGFKGKLPSMNSLKEEWGKLAQEKRQLYNGYKELRERDRALTTAKYNIDRTLNISPEELERQRQKRTQSHER